MTITRRSFIGAALSVVPLSLMATTIEAEAATAALSRWVTVYKGVKYPFDRPDFLTVNQTTVKFQCHDKNCHEESDYLITEMSYVAVHAHGSQYPVVGKPISYEWMKWDRAVTRDAKSEAQAWFDKMHGRVAS